MTMGVPSQTRAAKAGAKKAARRRRVRRVAKPAGKATWFVGKKVVKRKARKHARRYGDALRTAGLATLIYVPMAAEGVGGGGAAQARATRPGVPGGDGARCGADVPGGATADSPGNALTTFRRGR